MKTLLIVIAILLTTGCVNGKAPIPALLSPADFAIDTCKELGFTKGTEIFNECLFRIISAKQQNQKRSTYNPYPVNTYQQYRNVTGRRR